MSKGPALLALEQQQQALTDASVQQYKGLMDAQGTDPYGSVPLDRAETDDRWLGTWLILGQADDIVSTVFWADLARTQPVHEVAALDLRCRVAWADPARRESAMAVVGDDLRATYDWLRKVGWHSGHPRPRAEGNDPVSEGRGSAAGQSQGGM